MRISISKSSMMKAVVLLAAILLVSAGASFAQQTINLTAAPTTTTLPDGSVVPMWGYFCGTAVAGSTATCGPLNPSSVGVAPAPSTWSPVLITVPSGQGLTINLTNSLSFQPPTPTGGTAPAPNNIPTSIVIIGQVGGGLGASSTSTPSPSHANAQGCATWFIASGATPPGVPCTSQQAGASGIPPAQGPRVQSMATEVTEGTTTALTWANLKPGTYLLESGTHPSIQVPMGLIGMLVVTQAPTSSGATAGIAYPAVSGVAAAVPYNAELPLEFSEIDPVQNKEVDSAVHTAGFSETAVWTQMNTGSITSLTLTQGSGYTSAPTVTFSVPVGQPGGGAAATAALGYGVATVSVSNGGSGYTTPPTVTFVGSGSSDGAATATLAPQFTGVSITSGGTGYAVGNALTFTGGGTPTTAATGSVSSISAGVSAVTVSGGTGYTAPTVMFSGGGGSGAAATATVSGGTITVTVTNAGSGYTSAPTVTINDPTGTGATATATLATTGTITGVTVSVGAGYTSAPTITAAGGTGAVLVATFPISTTVTVTSGGAYASAPAVQFTGGGGTGAAATATLSTTSSLSLTLTNGGGGYTSAPTVTLTGGGFTTAATATATIGAGGCGIAHTCYPPAVNYTPFYYLIDGLAFNKTNPALSLFKATAGTTTCPVGTVTTTCPATTGIPATGTLLVRLVNAGLRMHVPSIVGSQTAGFTGAGIPTTSTNPVSGFTLIAEDGNVIPGVAPAGATTVPAAPRVQTDVFMAAGKVFDVMVNVPATPTGATTPPSLPIYDRELSLSGNSSNRDAGMLAYIGVNGAGLPLVSTGTGGLFAAAFARPDTYNALAAGQVFRVTDVSKGVIANDTNVYGVTLLAAPANGTLTCEAQPQNPVAGICANGTFTYTPSGTTTTSDSFTYCANGSVTTTGTTSTCSSGLTAPVTLGPSTLTGGPTAVNQTYTAQTSTYIKIPSPGLLIGNSDTNNLPLSLVTANPPAGVTWDAKGGFNVVNPTPSTIASTLFTFAYTIQNSQGRTATGNVTVTFPVPSNLNVKVVDAQAYSNCHGDSACIAGLTQITDYRWIIEEDRTFYVDPNCTSNLASTTLATTMGCPGVVGNLRTPAAPSGTTTVPAVATSFHTSTMPFVAQGCTGTLSCEGGQTMYDNDPTSPTFGTHIPAVCDMGNGACRLDTTGNGFTAVQPSSVVLDPKKRYYITVLPGDAANPFPSYAGYSGCDPKTGALPAANPITGVIACGHTQSGAPIPAACNILGGSNPCTASSTFAPVTVLALPTPLPPGRLSVMVFEDDFPLNGEQDAGGGVDTVSPNEPGLGGFNIILWDTFGDLGDPTGQDTYDMFNQPLSNSLAGTVDPVTGLDACPISATPNQATGAGGLTTGNGAGPAPATAMTGMIVTCPKFEADGTTLSPLAGQAVIANLMPDKFSVQAYPGADRIARGEEWIQTNTLDGQHPHDSFIRIGEPGYFQEYGPAGYHVSIGFANPKIINDRAAAVCAGAYGAVGPCTNTIEGQVGVQRQSRTPDQRLYPSGSRDALTWTQCWVSLGDPDAEDFMFTKCDANGNFKFSNVPGGNWRLTIGDQWNDQIIDGLSTPANVGGGCTAGTPGCTGGVLTDLNLGKIGVQQWQANLYTRTFVDDNKNGIWDPGEIGVPQVYFKVRYRDGHRANVLLTDPNGIANFNETFPLFNWYVVEADTGRYKTTGIHTVYDAGGPADNSGYCGPSGQTGTGGTARGCGTPATTTYNFLANTYEAVPLPADLSVPGAVYCALADCTAEANASFVHGTAVASSSTASTGRIDPPWVYAEGWSGETSQGNWIEFGKAPYAACDPSLGTVAASNSYCATVTTTAAGSTNTLVGENGGIHGFVDYSSTRPFDSAAQMIEQPWEPYVPGVTLNLYQEGFAADGVTPTLTLVDTTKSDSWDDWAQGFYPNSTAGSGSGAGQKPYMSCPGQGVAPTLTNPNPMNADLFFLTLNDQPNWLDWYNSEHNGGTLHTLPYNSQFKCYDAMHIWNQVQPATYDGHYQFPSVLGINSTSAGGTGWLNTSLTGGVHGGSNPNPTTGITPASMPGTNCTVCVSNPDATDVYRVGTPMLPPGKYVVEVIMPPGFEVYKEEDKNLLIGDNFIAPVTQQFGGLGADIFIIPDQASVASLYDPNGTGYNPNNFQNQTTGLNLTEGTLSGVPGFPGFQDPLWPCVGEMRVVPDYLSLFPQAKEVAPFAGATRPLCDRKEVTLGNQMSVSAKFFIYTSTHIASKFTGVITDDFTSEFDPFAPQFGEKFAPSNMPISTKDYLGNEISRVYADQWGVYDGLTFSSWEVNPPNITGYSPIMMVQCMNDAGPMLDTRTMILNDSGAFVLNPTYGQMINDPLYQQAYSNFCYEEPYMPGTTTYLDTPVVPTQAFVGAGYNNADCAYPDATPAIAEVDSSDGIGPWVSAAGRTLTIAALGNQSVTNYGYAGPGANTAPFSLKTVTRHYGFGNRCTSPSATNATCNTASSVTIGGVPATIGTWSDTSITVTAPNNVPLCAIQQQSQYGGPTLNSATNTYSPIQARCGELVITAGNGRQSIDTVTVTIGGKRPAHVNASGTIQSAIDGAQPGDLLIIDPTCTVTAGTTTTVSPSCTTPGVNGKKTASHNEMLIMWKPVRLQGVGAATTIVNANTHPAGKQLDPWRRHINCLFGLTLQGVPIGTPIPTSTPGVTTPALYDSNNIYSCPDTGWTAFGAVPPNNPQIDRLPLEATVGWDATQNGNLAEQLQEPSLMGAYEGAAITVLGKGMDFHAANPWSDTNEAGAFPAVATLLTGVVSDPGDLTGADAIPLGDANLFCHTLASTGTTSTSNAITSQANPYPSNFVCNPSSIDGLAITNSSQGGGGIFVHGWAHYLQIANNRVYNNAGTLSGGISVGQGEFPTALIQGSTTNAAPGSCSDGTGFVTNQHLPYCLQLHVNVHHNSITDNSSIGDELFSATLSGGGGVSICTGNDYYRFNYNWVCGNISTGEGGGMVHLGEIQGGDIERNAIIFNQSSNPTIPTNGGGIAVQGTPDTDPVCPGVPDTDCPPALSDGIGHLLIINANLIQGNSADSGSGGGIRLSQVNGTEVGTFAGQPQYWNDVTITNNIIVNNMAGWDGAGISLQDALNVNIVNNTIMNNDTLASSGVLTTSIGAPQASSPTNYNCVTNGPTGPTTASCPQSAGVTSTQNSTLMTTAMTGLTITCPPGHSGCQGFSNPLLLGDVIYQNRSFYIGITGSGTGQQNQQNLVGLYDAFGSTPAPNQGNTGACSTSDSYWDLGVRGDTGPSNHGSGFTLTPVDSIVGANPGVISSYCNGSRVPPECLATMGCGGPHGFGTPPGIADALTPNPVFSLTPSATVDEGNNWINVSWGPLSLTNPSVLGPAPVGASTGNYGGGTPLGNYSIISNSPAANYITCTNPNAVGQGCNVSVPAMGGQPAFSVTLPKTDFFGNRRPDPGTGAAKQVDAGAVEVQVAGGTASDLITGIAPNDGLAGTSFSVTISGFGFVTGTTVSAPSGIAVSNIVVAHPNAVTATFQIAPTTAAGYYTITVNAGGASATVPFLVLRPTLTSITPATGTHGTSVPVTIIGANLGTAISVNAPGITVSNFAVVNSDTVTATLNLAAGTVGNQNITVTTAGGAVTNAVVFAVN